MEIYDINTKALLLSLKALLAIRENTKQRGHWSTVNIKAISASKVTLELVGPYTGARITLHCATSSWEVSELIPDIQKYKFLIDQAWADKEHANHDGKIVLCETTRTLKLLYGAKEILVRDGGDNGCMPYPDVDSFFDRPYVAYEDLTINMALMATIARAFKPLFSGGAKMIPFKFQSRGTVINLDSVDKGLIAGIDHIQVITTRVGNHKGED